MQSGIPRSVRKVIVKSVSDYDSITPKAKEDPMAPFTPFEHAELKTDQCAHADLSISS